MTWAWLPHTCTCAMFAYTCWRSTFCFLYNIVIHLALLVGVGSCLQQSLNCLSMSLLGSYPERNRSTLMRERERLWIVEFSNGRSVRTRHLRVWFQRIREWDTTLTNTQTIQCVTTQTCKWSYKKKSKNAAFSGKPWEKKEPYEGWVWDINNPTLCTIAT